MPRLALHIRNVVVHDNAVALDHYAAAEEMADSLARLEARAFAVDYYKMRRSAPRRRRIEPLHKSCQVDVHNRRIADQRMQFPKYRSDRRGKPDRILVVSQQRLNDSGAAARRRRIRRNP